MSLLVVGSVAIDTVITPHGHVSEALGGSGAYFAYAASYFAPVRLVGVVGEDFPDSYYRVLASRPEIDLSGLIHEMGKTFRWKGRYSQDMNSRETLEVHLNVFGTYDPDIPATHRDARFVFLANGSPVIQRKVLHQIRRPELVFADTMDLWIETERDELIELLRQIDGLVINDAEVLMLTEENQLVRAGQMALQLGPRYVIVKKGEHGSLLFSDDGVVALPGYPTHTVVDPTGAGDCFAGAIMGYLAAQGASDRATFKRALAYGTVVASIVVEEFSLRALQQSTREDIERRYKHYCHMLNLS
jgi:sugar/nucleoside kinase (ribokinase family)